MDLHDRRAKILFVISMRGGKMDQDGYPDEDELKKIQEWDAINDAVGLVQYIRELWKFGYAGYFQLKDGILELHTAGWSGNESIIDALMSNTVFWTMFWSKSERGGHYYFSDKHMIGGTFC